MIRLCCVLILSCLLNTHLHAQQHYLGGQIGYAQGSEELFVPHSALEENLVGGFNYEYNVKHFFVGSDLLYNGRLSIPLKAGIIIRNTKFSMRAYSFFDIGINAFLSLKEVAPEDPLSGNKKLLVNLSWFSELGFCLPITKGVDLFIKGKIHNTLMPMLLLNAINLYPNRDVLPWGMSLSIGYKARLNYK